MTVILRGNGDMIWDWGTLWEEKIPDQDQIIQLVRNLNSWRTGEGKEFLVTGRMIKPLPFEGAYNVPMVTKPVGRNLNFPSLFTSNWQTENGKRAQFFVNYMPVEQEITINTDGLTDVDSYEKCVR